LRDEVSLFRQFALVARRYDQILATLAAIWAGDAHVDDETEERVVDRAGSRSRRNLNYRWPIVLHLSVPMRACTASGVRIFSGILLLNPGVGGWRAAGCCAYALVIANAPARTPATSNRLCLNVMTVLLFS
jgi:hypothetical protein